ncbi:hypothetical protein BJ508DRAFT_376554 [Ascobolus immersus RN42]|uniref:Uncharacterized protein n=1 Tax=Ascobolus immersus RN42 TaxID=1160509 RepID=A0A3N4I975_ASCIM|nr:hypothetical protein BJ508DRAFT_376554 [Ascobolus immersus RN42]
MEAHREIESWDDDLDFELPTDFKTGTSSVATRSRRGSMSSRMSMNSEGFDMVDFPEKVLFAPDNDFTNAIASAHEAGIPIPDGVPASALVGGVIRRLGAAKPKAAEIQEDWSDDLEFPEKGAMRIHKMGSDTPAVLETSPKQEKPTTLQSPVQLAKLKPVTMASRLDRFREDANESFEDANSMSPLQIPKSLQRNKVLEEDSARRYQEATRALGAGPEPDDFDADIDFPEDTNQLRLRGAQSVANFQNLPDDATNSRDVEEWLEESLGARFPNVEPVEQHEQVVDNTTTQDTAAIDSDDEGLDDIVFPEDNFDFGSALQRRRAESFASQAQQETVQRVIADISPNEAAKDDFFSGIEFGDETVFDSGKLTLNRNIQHKQLTKKKAPGHRSAMSLFFTNKPTRPPRLSNPPLPSQLEKIAEASDSHNEKTLPTLRHRKSQSTPLAQTASSQIGKHGSGLHNIPPPPPVPTTPSSRNRIVATRSPKATKGEPTTTSAQLLRMKRSMPNVRSTTSSPSQRSVTRTPSRTEGQRPTTPGRSKTPNRAKTPSDRGDTTPTRRPPVPGLPTASPARSQIPNVSVKTTRHKRTESSPVKHSTTRPSSRHSGRGRPTSLIMKTPGIAPESLKREAASTKVVTHPARRRNYGDGSELQIFDDLPTNPKVEKRFTVQPVGRGAPNVKTLRAMSVPFETPSKFDTPSKAKVEPVVPPVQSKLSGSVPSFARDTKASRTAREQRTSALQANNSHWRMQIALRNASPKTNKKPQQRPHLIKPLGNASNQPKVRGEEDPHAAVEETRSEDPLNGDISFIDDEPFTILEDQMVFDENTPFNVNLDFSPSKPLASFSPRVQFLIPVSRIMLTKPPPETALKGMTYNPRTFRWEGNEQAVRDFETPQPPPTPPTTAARPALISNVSSTKNVQVVGGMVFDPSRMCWLKVTEDSEGESERDPFEGLDDLEDSTSRISGGTHGDLGNFGEFVVGEEFDVGPVFVSNQREEEKRWRVKLEGWVAPQKRFDVKQKWELRELVMRSVQAEYPVELDVEEIATEQIGIAV